MNEQQLKAKMDAVIERACQIELTEAELEELCGGSTPKLMLSCATGQHMAMGDGSVRFLRDTVSV
ncbi:MAG: H-X9-DG-CTERM domain-containing protein [Gemmataceae bacterium]